MVASVLVLNLYVIVKRNLLKDPFPTVFGFGSAVVVSDSMETELSKGDVIIVRRADEYVVGDILTFEDMGGYTTHRLIEIREDSYVTKGDNNDAADLPVAAERVVGKVRFVIPSVGKALDFISSPVGLLLMFAICVGIIFLPDAIRAAFHKEEGDEVEP